MSPGRCLQPICLACHLLRNSAADMPQSLALSAPAASPMPPLQEPNHSPCEKGRMDDTSSIDNDICTKQSQRTSSATLPHLLWNKTAPLLNQRNSRSMCMYDSPPLPSSVATEPAPSAKQRNTHPTEQHLCSPRAVGDSLHRLRRGLTQGAEQASEPRSPPFRRVCQSVAKVEV